MGRHRYKVCQELGFASSIKTQIKKFDDPLYEKLFVIDANLERRHINYYQRTSLALKKKPVLDQIAERNSQANLKRGTIKPESPNSKILVVGKDHGVNQNKKY
jgi:hypothetical protein